LSGLRPRLRKNREQDRSEDGNDGDNYEKLDQGERRLAGSVDSGPPFGSREYAVLFSTRRLLSC